MISKISQSGVPTYGICEFVLDSEADLQDLPKDAQIGSAALVISSAKIYMINSEGEWKEV